MAQMGRRFLSRAFTTERTPGAFVSARPLRGAGAYSISSWPRDPELLADGGLEVLAADCRGFLRATPGQAWGFAYESGEPYFAFGDTTYNLFGMAHCGYDVPAFLQRRAQQGFNLLRVRLPVSPFHPPSGYSRWQTRRTWPWGGSEQSPRFDQFDLDYFHTVDAVIGQCEALGIGLEMIMEAWGFEFPFNSRAIFLPEWEELWLRYLIARYDAYNCVHFWTLMNEYEYYPNGDWHYKPVADRWAMRVGRWVKQVAGHGHIVSVHNGPREPSFGQRFAADPGAIDAIMFQEWGSRDQGSGLAGRWHRGQDTQCSRDWPGSAIFAEWGYERNPAFDLDVPGHLYCDEEHTRRGAWRGAFCGLGIIHGFENSWGPWCKLDEDQPGMADLLLVRRFFREIVPFERLRPAMQWVTRRSGPAQGRRLWLWPRRIGGWRRSIYPWAAGYRWPCRSTLSAPGGTIPARASCSPHEVKWLFSRRRKARPRDVGRPQGTPRIGCSCSKLDSTRVRVWRGAIAVSVISELPRGEMPTEVQDSSLVRLQIGRLALQMGSPDGAALSLAADKPLVRPKADPILLRLRPAPAMLARSADMVALRDAVHAGQVAHLYGAPGMGKTALLSQLAYQVPRSWCPDGAIYLRARYADLSDLLQALYDLMHEPGPTFKPTLDELVAGLQDRQVLLLLDDISLPSEAIQSLVQALPAWRFVLVATQRLSLGDAYAHSLDGLSPDDALTLAERQVGHWVSSAERPIVQRACVALQGNPLFLLQLVALARKRDWPLFELVTDLASSRAPEALQEQILESLTEPERRVLAALASAEGVPLSVAALGAVTELPQVAPILEELQRQYLIEGQGSLYRVRHPLAVAVRQASDTVPWLWRVLSYTLESLEQGHPLPNDDEVLCGLPLLCGAAARAGWSPEVIRLARAAEGYLALARRWGAWKAVLTYALHASRLVSDRANEAWALHQLGTMAVCLGDARSGRAQLTRSLRLQTREAAKTLTEQNLGFFRANAGEQRASPSGGDQDAGSLAHRWGSSLGPRCLAEDVQAFRLAWGCLYRQFWPSWQPFGARYRPGRTATKRAVWGHPRGRPRSPWRLPSLRARPNPLRLYGPLRPLSRRACPRQFPHPSRRCQSHLPHPRGSRRLRSP